VEGGGEDAGAAAGVAGRGLYARSEHFDRGDDARGCDARDGAGDEGSVGGGDVVFDWGVWV